MTNNIFRSLFDHYLQPYVTELDLKLSSLGGQTMESLKTQLPVIEEDREEGFLYDYNKFLDSQFI